MAFSNPHITPYLPGERLTAAVLNAICQMMPQAVDGVGGGSYALSAPLSITGQPVAFTTVNVSGNVNADAVHAASDVECDNCIAQDTVYAQASMWTDGLLEVGPSGSFLVPSTANYTLGGAFSGVGNACILGRVLSFSSTGRIPYRAIAGSNIDGTYDVTQGNLIVATVSANRIYTLANANAVTGDFWHIYNTSAFDIAVRREDATTLLTLNSGGTGAAGDGKWSSGLFVRLGGVWVVAGRGH